MTRLTVYGDFNCPFSALASVRADVLLAAHSYAIDCPLFPRERTRYRGRVLQAVSGHGLDRGNELIERG